VVLELGDEDDVAGAEVVETPRVGDEVDPLRRSVREDQLARVGRVDEARDLVPGALVLGGGLLGQGVDASVNVGVRGLVEGAELVEHLARLLRARRRVEV
jgi:hypothetical protein